MRHLVCVAALSLSVGCGAASAGPAAVAAPNSQTDIVSCKAGHCFVELRKGVSDGPVAPRIHIEPLCWGEPSCGPRSAVLNQAALTRLEQLVQAANLEGVPAKTVIPPDSPHKTLCFARAEASGCYDYADTIVPEGLLELDSFVNSLIASARACSTSEFTTPQDCDAR